MKIPCKACNGEALDLVDYKREDRVSCQRCKGTGKDPAPTQEDIDRYKRSIRPHSPDAYALVEKVLRNREVLRTGLNLMEAEELVQFHNLHENVDQCSKWMDRRDFLKSHLQQLIDLL